MKMRVFFSWQNETNCLGFNNKKLIFESICKACKEIELKGQLKDITFEVNKYEINTNTFKSIFKEEKIEDTFKFFILCSGYSLARKLLSRLLKSRLINVIFSLVTLLLVLI